MLDGFAAHTHGLRVLIEPRLRGFDDVFVFPAFDAALVGRCALILERACAARLRQVNPHFLAIFISGEVVLQLLAGRAAIDIVLGRSGWTKRSLQPGDHAVFRYAPLRDGNAGGFLLKVTLSSGQELSYTLTLPNNN